MPKPAIEFIRHMHEEGNFILKNTVKVDLDELLQNMIQYCTKLDRWCFLVTPPLTPFLLKNEGRIIFVFR